MNTLKKTTHSSLLLRGLALTLFLFLCCMAHAQAPTTGDIRGFVRSANDGNPLVAVEISLRHKGQTKKSGVTNEDGEFNFQGLAQGKYILQASNPGFQTQKQTVYVDPGKTKDVNFDLKLKE